MDIIAHCINIITNLKITFHFLRHSFNLQELLFLNKAEINKYTWVTFV